MVISCSAYNCTNRFLKGSDIKFHKFPLANDSLCKQWVAAMKREHFKPTKWSYLCGKHFSIGDYKYSTNSVRLKDDAIPRIFDFPDHLCGNIFEKRLAPKKRLTFEDDEEQPSGSKSETKVRKLNISPSKEDLISLVKLQQVKIKSLQQKVCRKQNKIKSLKDCIDTLSNDKQEAVHSLTSTLSA